MARLKNVNPIGAVDFPLLGRVLEAGEEFDVDDDTAALLLEQDGNFQAVTKTTTKAKG